MNARVRRRVSMGSALALGCFLTACDSAPITPEPAPTATATAAAAATAKVAPPAKSGVRTPADRPAVVEDWNDTGIAWRGYDEGLAEAKRDKKPICLVLYTTWCPHCKNYSNVFGDPRVVEQAKKFVMIRLDKDKNTPVSAKYSPDGEYIPRTFFLASDGTLDATIHAPRDKYQFFYDERDPTGLLASMTAAAGKLK